MSDMEERYIDDVVADLHVVKTLLEDNRPLQALKHTNDCIELYELEKERQENG